MSDGPAPPSAASFWLENGKIFDFWGRFQYLLCPIYRFALLCPAESLLARDGVSPRTKSFEGSDGPQGLN